VNPAAPQAPNHLVVYLSGRCNLSCAYCYSSAPGGPVIKKDALLGAVGDFLRSAPRGAKISFLGGEPLLHKPLLRAAVRLVRAEAGASFPVTVFTNGLLLDRAEAAFLKENSVKTVVSLDGDPAAAGYARGRAPDLSRLDASGLSASAVVTPATAARLAENVAWLYQAGFRSIGWAPDVKAVWDRAALARLAASAAALRKFYLGLLRAGLPPFELANAYEALDAERGRPPARACLSLTLAPDGRIYPCDKLAGLGAPGPGLPRDRDAFFSAAAAAGFRPYGLMCPVAPWAAAGCPTGKALAARRSYFAGQAAARLLVRRWLTGLAAAGLRYPAFRRVHNIR